MHNNTNKQKPIQLIDGKKIKEDFEKIINTIKENIEKQQRKQCPLFCPIKEISFAKNPQEQEEHSELRNLLLVKQCPPRICKPKPVFPKIDLNQLFKPKHK